MSDVRGVGLQIATQGGISNAIKQAHADVVKLTSTLSAGGVSPQQLTDIGFSSVGRALGQRPKPASFREQDVGASGGLQADDSGSAPANERTTTIGEFLANRSAMVTSGQPEAASSKSSSRPTARRPEPVKAAQVLVAQQPTQSIDLTPALPPSPPTTLEPPRRPDPTSMRASPEQTRTSRDITSTRDSNLLAGQQRQTSPTQSADPSSSPRPIQLAIQAKSIDRDLPAEIRPSSPAKSYVPPTWPDESSSAYEQYLRIGTSLAPSLGTTLISQPTSLPQQPEAWGGAVDQVDAPSSSEHLAGGGPPMHHALSPRAAPSGRLAITNTQQSVGGRLSDGPLDSPEMSTEHRPRSMSGQNPDHLSGQAPLTEAQGGQAISGDVYLDGVAVGRWMSRMMSKEAERASAGPTGYDLRRGRLLPGPSVGM